MDKLIQEELERMKLLSRYDNSKTLTEQTTPNQQAAMRAGYGSVNPERAEQLAAQGKLKTNVNTGTGQPMVTKPANPVNKFNVLPTGQPKPSGKPTTDKPTTGGQPMVRKPANPADKFNVLPTRQSKQNGNATTGGQPMIYKEPTFADKFNERQQSLGQLPSAVNPSDLAKQGKGKPVANKPSEVPKPKKPVAPPIQLGNGDGIKLFQDWLDKNAPGWATGYKGGVIDQGRAGGGYGKFGPRTKKAWDKYKDQYLQMEPITPKGIKELPVQIQGPPQIEKLQIPSQAKYTGIGPVEQ